MNDKYESNDQSSLSTTKGAWEAPSIEELDFSSTDAAVGSPGTADGPYVS
jgi:hypothetical protein